ncbi:MAG: hypothetical protein M1827_006046 [Pycnora praestabilis]|nr:MAG: hypothetical protein M1827_006046 [Pycnora praestabilis]
MSPSASITPKSAVAPNDAFWNSMPPQLRMSITASIPADEITQMTRQYGDTETPKAKYQAIEELLSRTIATKKDTLGPEHADTLNTMHALAMVQTELDEDDRAEKTYRKMLEAYEKTGGPNRAFAVMNNLAFVLNRQGKYAEAEQILRKLLPPLQERGGRDTPQALGCMRKLMEAVGGQGRYEEAKEINVEGFELVGKMDGEERPAEMEAMEEVKLQLEAWRSGRGVAVH